MYSYPGLGYQPVRFYDAEKRFGFLQDPYRFKSQVFFHLNDGRAAIIDPLQDEVVFGTQPVTREPRVGEYLIYREGKNAKGPKAVQWILHDEFAALRDALPDYRIRKVRTGPGYNGPRLEPAEQYWWWNNICYLNACFARGGDRVPKHLPPHSGEDEHGPFTLVWEKGLPSKGRGNYEYLERRGWEVCEDPRHESLR